MADANSTARCGLPLLQPAQAQKHVTVNDAMMRLDGLVNLVLESVRIATPPAVVPDGASWGVPVGAVNAWQGRAGQIATGANGGWVFTVPRRGQRAFVADEGAGALFDGLRWATGAITLGLLGGGLSAGVTEGEWTVTAGTALTTDVVIPGNVLIIGTTARVAGTITGTLTSWSLGVAGAVNRFGSGLGLAQGSWGQGLLSAPMANYAPAALRLQATGGAFAAGRVRLSVHWLEMRLPHEAA
ncbi:DUF2793 domain-containing protein [Paracoccus luteus]|uniref:DUF2793 domain-containing protein n=1 Tax=Paracoccus luteus TaxID=2508543 RepID=UPI00106F20D7|nr:DUF2793 domain-containing protein [Paracoccus luteus]